MSICSPNTGHSTGSEYVLAIEIGWLPRPARLGRVLKYVTPRPMTATAALLQAGRKIRMAVEDTLL